MSQRKNIPHIANVRLVEKSRSNAGAPGFGLQITGVWTFGLLIFLLLAYFILSQ
jgi:hypothetical protein